MSGGELLALIQDVGRLTVPSALFYAANVLTALAYFDSIGLCHRDLKPENMLIDSRGYIRICDFGYARQLMSDERCFTLCGTPEYMAPEVILATPYRQAVDWWALGILLHEMLIGEPPFAPHANVDSSKEESFVVVARAIFRYASRGAEASPPLPWCCFDKHAASLIKLLMRVDPAERPRPRECMVHPFFAGTDFLDLERRRIPAPYLPFIKSDTGISDFHDTGDCEQASGTSTIRYDTPSTSPETDSKASTRPTGVCPEAFEPLKGFIEI